MVEKAAKSVYEYLKGFPHLIVLIVVIGMFLYRDQQGAAVNERIMEKVNSAIRENSAAIQSVREVLIQLRMDIADTRRSDHGGT